MNQALETLSTAPPHVFSHDVETVPWLDRKARPGEKFEAVYDLCQTGCEMLTIGQYLTPSDSHLPVERYYTPDEFGSLCVYGEEIGFKNVASGPAVRFSYHAVAQSGLPLVGNAL